MSGSIINWRFGMWHFKILKDPPFVEVSRNYAHAPECRPDGWRWFERYK